MARTSVHPNQQINILVITEDYTNKFILIKENVFFCRPETAGKYFNILVLFMFSNPSASGTQVE